MTMSALGWIDTYAALIVPGMATSFSLFLMRQFMIQIPDDLLSARPASTARGNMPSFSVS